MATDAEAHERLERREVPCLWFFIPLPHPVALPGGWMHEMLLPAADLVRAPQFPSDVASSLLIHQVQTTTDRLEADLDELWEFAARVMAEPSHATAGATLPTFPESRPAAPRGSARTIAEVALPGVTVSSEAEMLSALDIAIGHIRFAQRALAVATQEPVRLVARATLPPSVPIFSGAMFLTNSDDGDQALPRIDNALVFFVPACSPPVALNVPPEPLTEAALDRLDRVVGYAEANSPFEMFADLRREAMVQRTFDGNSRMTVVALATAGEVLLDTMLMHMLWEEHVDPKEAARYFDRNEGHTARLRKRFPPRLGGAWDPDPASAPGRYQRDVIQLRHRVVHAGHEPNTVELDAAWEAIFHLERFLGDRLAAEPNLKRYPRTAMAWMAETGLRTRNRWTNYIRDLSTDPREPNWAEAFARWRHHLDRALTADPERPGTEVDRLMLLAEKTHESVRWIIHDAVTAHAAVVEPTSVRNPDEIAEVERRLFEMSGDHLRDRRLGSALGCPPPPGTVWLPDHELFEEFTLYAGKATAGPSEA